MKRLPPLLLLSLLVTIHFIHAATVPPYRSILLESPTGYSGGRMGESLSISRDGIPRIAIGAPFHSPASQGEVYTFILAFDQAAGETLWRHEQTLKDPTPQGGG